MIPNRCSCEFQENSGGTVPPPFPCGRIATNQVGEFSTLVQPSLGAGILLYKWTGLTSGATGFHNDYFYSVVPFVQPTQYQQWIVMFNITGTFADGENLKVEDSTGAHVLNPVPSYSTRSTVNGGASNDHVNCDTGGGPSGGGGGGGGGPVDTVDDGGIHYSQSGPGTAGPPVPDTEFDPSDVYEINTAADYSANTITGVATVTGLISGATALFVSWPGGNFIRVSNAQNGPTRLFFLPNEEFTVTTLEQDTVLPNMYFGTSTGATIV